MLTSLLLWFCEPTTKRVWVDPFMGSLVWWLMHRMWASEIERRRSCSRPGNNKDWRLLDSIALFVAENWSRGPCTTSFWGCGYRDVYTDTKTALFAMMKPIVQNVMALLGLPVYATVNFIPEVMESFNRRSSSHTGTFFLRTSIPIRPAQWYGWIGEWGRWVLFW